MEQPDQINLQVCRSTETQNIDPLLGEREEKKSELLLNIQHEVTSCCHWET